MHQENNKRILIYSHDSYGLGHLRRCQTIAHALVEANPDLSVLILSGSPVVGQFEWKQGVDFVRLPGIVKLHTGDYSTHHLNISLSELVSLRSNLIKETLKSYIPDLFIVDKEPLGLRGELKEPLLAAEKANIPAVLGLRDVLDEKEALFQEWERKNIFKSLPHFYKEIWVYGVKEMGNPLEGLPIQNEPKIYYTGYLNRVQNDFLRHPNLGLKKIKSDDPFILAMAGGGGDGETLIAKLLDLYKEYQDELQPIVIVLGPFMPKKFKKIFLEEAQKLHKVELLFFSPTIEILLSKAKGIISMGGYNSFCEILSFNKPALVYPRCSPRKEQLIRAERAAKKGFIRLLDENDLANLSKFKNLLQNLPNNPFPDQYGNLGEILGGLNWIQERVSTLLNIQRVND